MTSYFIAALNWDFLLEWLGLGPSGNPGKLKPVATVLGIALITTQLIYYWVKIAQDVSRRKRPGGLLVRINKFVSKHPWVLTAVNFVLWLSLLLFVGVLAIQIPAMARQISVLSSQTLPGGRNENITALEQRIRALEQKTAVHTQSQPQQRPVYKLVWFNHFAGNMLYNVTKTDTSKIDVRNDEFQHWNPSPFVEQDWIIQERWLVAADEEFKPVPGQPNPENWWSAPAYDNLPKLNPRWLQIMDDERWYVYKVMPRN